MENNSSALDRSDDMNIIIRTDSSDEIGAGHLMRCLTLADELKKSNATVSFICREETGNLIELIKKKGYKVHSLTAGFDIESDREYTRKILKDQNFPDWLIVDHYKIDFTWESSLRDLVKNIMIIDDLADRKHDCDILLDQNYSSNKKSYDGLVPDNCIRLMGLRYALLRPQFIQEHENLKKRTGEVKRVLVFMGGADPTNQTCKVLRAIKMVNSPDITIDIIIGASNKHRQEIEYVASTMLNASCHYNIENMAELMAAADLSIGGGGTASWERCFLGLPTIVITIAENQVTVAKQLAGEGYIIDAGWHEDVNKQNIFEDFMFLLRHKEILKHISSKAKSLVDGKGTKRVKSYLLKKPEPICLRPATTDDCQKIFEWRNNPEVRKYFFNSSSISEVDHEQWFKNAISSSNTALLVGESNNDPVGVSKYDLKDDTAFVSIYVIPGLFNKGFGSRMLEIGNTWIKRNHKSIKKIVAEIIPQNTASIKAFKKAGFKESNLTYVYNCNEDVL